MKKNRLRVFMTVLATTMACAFLIVLASVGFGVHKSVTEEFTSHQLLTEIRVYGKQDGPHHSNITEEDVSSLKETDQVQAVVTRKYYPAMFDVQYDDRKAGVQGIVTNMEEEVKGNLRLQEGNVPKDKEEVLVGYHLAQNLLTAEERKELEAYYVDSETNSRPKGLEESLLGETITIELKSYEEDDVMETFTFTVAGVTEEPAKDWMEDSSVYISESFRSHLDEVFAEVIHEDEPLFHDVLVYVDGIQNVQSVTNVLKESQFMVYSITEELDKVNLFFAAFKIGLIFVGTVAILIASIGIFNTMTMAVTERTQEIGIMKALGANPHLIRKMFLIESAYIGMIGTFIGIVLSFAVSFLANTFIPLLLEALLEEGGMTDFHFSYIPMSLVIIAAFISIGVAMISGMRPAIKATNINVLTALRREL